jgi:rfaE bifunctional protein nucleotidyltransferase chain/domain
VRVVLANGCFDPLHAGHVAHLREARALGDYLVVALTADEAVGKPSRPFYPWEHRATILRELRCVDSVMKTWNAIDAIHAVKPNVFVKGIDYSKLEFPENVMRACVEVGATIAITQTEKLSATEVVRKIREEAA